MNIGNKIEGKVIDKYIKYDRNHYTIELKNGQRETIMEENEDIDPIVCIGDTISVEKINDYCNTKNYKIIVIK